MGTDTDELEYLSGLGNEFCTEALPGALPQNQNNPQVCPYGLYAEQISGTAFTAPRRANKHSWLYRIKPSVTHEPFSEVIGRGALSADFSDAVITPNQLRWFPMCLPPPAAERNFIEGLVTICGSGSAMTKDGYAIHTYCANTDMDDICLANADGEMLIVPQQGTLSITTEMGKMRVQQGEVCVIPRGVRFSIALPEEAARGYVLEVFAGEFMLPELGPIGANGLADPRHFLSPTAWYEDREGEFRVVHKFGGNLFEAKQGFSPFNVVAWHGNLTPYKYDLGRFCPVNAVSFDHPDPSIFTVLTVPSPLAGVAVADFVVFPPRWAVAEGTFRPPYYHRNTMSEFMGLVRGAYDGKATGFEPGGASLHSCMSPHGPDSATFEAATRPEGAAAPAHLPRDTLAFMFEVNAIPRVTRMALSLPNLDKAYYKAWTGLKRHFDPTRRDVTAKSLTADANGHDAGADTNADVKRQRTWG